MSGGQSDRENESVLRFENVSLFFDKVAALDQVSFKMAAGETRIVLGAAGSGKTALLKMAIGLLKADSGHVYLFGRDITDLRERSLYDIRSRVGVLFQEGGLFDSLTVGENVAYPLLNQRTRMKENQDASEAQEKVKEALRFVELEQTLDQFPNELSGGMRRRVGIARAVVTEPPLVLYDSPTAGLDPITANTIMALIAKERDSKNTANLIVTHRYQDGEIMANFRYNPEHGKLESANGGGQAIHTIFMVMNEGKLVFEGTKQELEASPDTYLRKFVRR